METERIKHIVSTLVGLRPLGQTDKNEMSRYIKSGITHHDDYWGAEMELMGYVGPPVV